MFQLDLKSRRSIYEQVIDGVKEQIMTGVLPAGSRLPSVRDLSKTLTVNPNTVQKAYRELEHQGYIYTVTGLGCFVGEPHSHQIDMRRVARIKEELALNVRELRYLGITADEIRASIDDVYRQEGDNL